MSSSRVCVDLFNTSLSGRSPEFLRIHRLFTLYTEVQKFNYMKSSQTKQAGGILLNVNKQCHVDPIEEFAPSLEAF